MPTAALQRLYFQDRFTAWRWLLGVFLLISAATRIALLVTAGPVVEPGFWPYLQIFGLGLVFDLVAASYFFVPLVLYLMLVPDWLYRHWLFRWTLYVGCGVWVFLMLFTAASELIFWDEFGSRFNFIAVDYLVYTQEVIGNIRESYPVGKILGGIAILAIVLVGGQRRHLASSWMVSSPWRERLLLGAVLLALPIGAFYSINHTLKDESTNRYVNALSGNGIYEFFAAAYNNELDYPTFYRNIPLDEAYAAVRKILPTPHARLASDQPYDLTRVVAYDEPTRKLNVVLISVESLSADFMGLFGRTDSWTPKLDQLATKSLVFTQLYATGTRTVRGLEALALSVPPSPGQSIVKRPNNGGLNTIGSILAEQGYDVRYMYGGYGYFDNMEPFFSANGYQVVDRTAIPDERIHLENIWGVADEDLFTQSLDELDKSHAAGTPSFTHIMTTSNHRPYTYPDGRIDLPSGRSGRPGAVKYTDWAINDFIERASHKPWFDDTVFVIVADHCASSAGKTELPVYRYHIPLLIYAPKWVESGQYTRLASQIDIAPTILGLLRVNYSSTFMGYDLLDLEPGRERAFISTYQELGYLRGDKLVTLNSRQQVATEQPKFASDTAVDLPHDEALEREAIAWYQVAAHAFKTGGLRRATAAPKATETADAR